MPKRRDLKKILVFGSGPIVIGQACEFDYSGTQAVRALKEEGYEVCLINSNPATIMTDPDLADTVYIEPLNVEYAEKIISLEKPNAVLPTMGGQTALNLTMALDKKGAFKKFNVEILGATPSVIERAEDRSQFKKIMAQIGIDTAKSTIVRNINDGKKILSKFGLPLILRPSFTLGGEGGGTAKTEREYFELLEKGLFLSPTHEVLVEESLLGWKEFEFEVVRDKNDNAEIICSIENFDPMGVHTGDSITVAPAMTLTDREYQKLRDQSLKIIRSIGVETGGSNIQFAVNPETGRTIVIEMNPRVSRSSALASKATGFPIARIAAKLAIGYTLDELKNEITKTTPASFEPALDYVVVKIPRFDFEKFPHTLPILSTQMKSVGEVMALGRTFEEAFMKAVSGLEVNKKWLLPISDSNNEFLDSPNPNRIWAIAQGLREGKTIEAIHSITKIDHWFLNRIKIWLDSESIAKKGTWTKEELKKLKGLGYTDIALADLSGKKQAQVRQEREKLEVFPTFQLVDTCAGEFEAKTPYYYSTYRSDMKSEVKPSDSNCVVVLGSGPNRIGQGIEFDYCCVHAALALRKAGIRTVMINSNPETVSTDFDISDQLYFEPVTEESVLEIARIEKPIGCIVQFGGQTPLKIAKQIEKNGLKILGTSTQSIDLVEDREKCENLVHELREFQLLQPKAATARTEEDALKAAETVGYPVLVRPSYVLGGRAMKIVSNAFDLKTWIKEILEVSDDHPILIDEYLENAIEVDVDALSDGKKTVVAGILQHIEEAGIHSGDSACCLPPNDLSKEICDRLRLLTRKLSEKVGVIGLLNIQFAIKGNEIYLIEMNPRASRTVPFVSKSIGRPIAQIAVQLMLGSQLEDFGIHGDLDLDLSLVSVKAPVFPFSRFPGSDVLLGPEMRSTGEVMGRAPTFPEAYAKALTGAGMPLPKKGAAFLSLRDEDKESLFFVAKTLSDLGFKLVGTRGTAGYYNKKGVEVTPINKVAEGSPHCVEAILAGEFDLVINTVSDAQAITDSFSIRKAIIEKKLPYATMPSTAKAMVEAILNSTDKQIEVYPL